MQKAVDIAMIHILYNHILPVWSEIRVKTAAQHSSTPNDNNNPESSSFFPELILYLSSFKLCPEALRINDGQ